MKHLTRLTLLFSIYLLSLSQVFAQTETVKKTVEENFLKSSFFLEGGANIPAFSWGSDYGYAKLGFEVGAGWDYYFLKRWGIGLDLRYHQNGVSRKENSINLEGSNFYSNSYIASVNEQTTSGSWSGTSLAIGPTFRTPLFGDKFVLEAFIKGGIALYRLPKLNQTYDLTDTTTQTTYSTTIIDGYTTEDSEKTDFKPFGITGVRFGYNLTDNWTVYASVNYKTTLIDRDDYYYNFDRTLDVFANLEVLDNPITEGGEIDGNMVDQSAGINGFERENITRNGSIQSFGALIGVKWTPNFTKKPKKKKKEVVEVFKEVDTVIIVKTDTVELKSTTIAVKVQDGPSGVIIPNSDVALLNEAGETIMTAKSDAFGMV
ncbi:MAG: outer membrane beta-barrel protein, partial [Flavobacteriales bacterium]